MSQEFSPLTTSRSAARIFGASHRVYFPLTNEVIPKILGEKYYFIESSIFEEVFRNQTEESRSLSGRIYWTEMLFRAHLAAATAMLRACRWIDVAIREYEAENLYGWAGACRSLIESAGDTGHSLSGVALILAQNHHQIQAEIVGKGRGIFFTSEELENALIHFTHARKIGRDEQVPAAHKAKQSREYIGFLEGMQIESVGKTYAALCEIVHPASESILTLLDRDGDSWTVSPPREKRILDKKVDESAGTLSEVLMGAFNPSILTLRVLHRFDLFRKIPELRKYKLHNIKMWQKIEAALKA